MIILNDGFLLLDVELKQFVEYYQIQD